MSTPKILTFAGSSREESFNKQLAKVAARCAEGAGAEVTVVDLRDFPMPLYCGDLHEEHGVPENAVTFKELMKSHDGFIIASPEYNGSLPGLLKNTIDWATIKHGDEARMACFDGKIAGLINASPGMGGGRVLQQLRAILSSLGTFVLPKHVNVTNCSTHLHGKDTIEDENIQQQLHELSSELVRVIRGLH